MRVTPDTTFRACSHTIQFCYMKYQAAVRYVAKSYFLLSMLQATGCAKKSTIETSEVNEVAQQIGDMTASIDESGGASGNLSYQQLYDDAANRLFARHGLKANRDGFDFLSQTANAATCLLQPGFGACAANTIIRDFASCTVGAATFTGTVNLVWAGAGSANCVLGGVSATITRSPAFTVTGLRGATLTVSKTGSIGQRLTWSSGVGINKVFQFSNDGIKRKFQLAGGTTLFDFTTTTSSNITVSGTDRSNRIVSGGGLQVVNNLNGVSCSFSPSTVSWSSNCNCPVSGSWTATCTDGKTGSLTHTSCGAASITIGGESESVVFDRCFGT